jgi:lycopene cyclase domain-containing protein
MPGAYLLALTLSVLGLVGIDQRHKIAFFKHPKRSALTLLVAVPFFILWDLTGIWFGVFFEQNKSFSVGLDLLPNLPVEEPVFLLLLCYTLLITYLLAERRQK